MGRGAQGGDRDPGRGDRLPVHDHPRLRDGGARGRLRARLECRGHRRAGDRRRPRARHGPGPGPRRVPGQRGGATERRDRRDARPLGLPGDPAARGADRLRQARPRPGQPRPAPGPDREDEGRPGLADHLRERPARPDGRRHRRQDGPLDDRLGPCGADGGRGADHSAPRPARGDRHLRRPAGGDGASRLSAQGTSRAEIRLRGRDQINRDHRFPRDRRVGARRSCRCRPRAVGAGRPGGASGCRTSASSARARTRTAS